MLRLELDEGSRRVERLIRLRRVDDVAVLEPIGERRHELGPRVRLDAAPLREQRDARAALVAAVVGGQDPIEGRIAHASHILQVRLTQD